MVVMYDFIEAFLLSVLPARIDSTQCRAQSQACLSYAETQGDGRSQLATVPLEVGCSNLLSYGNIFVLPARLELATLTFVA